MRTLPFEGISIPFKTVKPEVILDSLKEAALYRVHDKVVIA